MARIGVNNFRYAILKETEDGTATYSGAKKPGKAVSCKVDPENYDATLYADDELAESETGFKSAKVTLTIDEFDNQTQADLLGHELSDEQELIKKSDDVIPYVGIGRVITKKTNGAYKYTAKILYKVKFSEPSSGDEKTKGNDIEFGTVELSGTASTLKNHRWEISKDFDDKESAIEYIEKILGATTLQK